MRGRVALCFKHVPGDLSDTRKLAPNGLRGSLVCLFREAPKAEFTRFARLARLEPPRREAVRGPAQCRAGSLFHPVLGLRRRGRLPLHVAGRIGAATLQRDNVIDHVALAGSVGLPGCRAGMAGLKRSPGRRATCDPAIDGTGTGGAFLRRRSGACGSRPRSRSAGGARRTSRDGSRRTTAAGGGPRRDRGQQKAERKYQIPYHLV
jgi:hypothetical protein